MMSVVAHDEGSVTIDRYSSTVYCSVAERVPFKGPASTPCARIMFGHKRAFKETLSLSGGLDTYRFARHATGTLQIPARLSCPLLAPLLSSFDSFLLKLSSPSCHRHPPLRRRPCVAPDRI
jgi:hypothetical protein